MVMLCKVKLNVHDPSARPQIAILGRPGGGSGRSLEGLWGLRWPWEAKKPQGEKKLHTSQLKCKISFFSSFYDVFLKVRLTKYCKIQGNLLAGSATGSGAGSWAELKATP